MRRKLPQKTFPRTGYYKENPVEAVSEHVDAALGQVAK
jgi:hypothetical protein